MAEQHSSVPSRRTSGWHTSGWWASGVVLALAGGVVLSGCGSRPAQSQGVDVAAGGFKDGTYSGRSQTQDDGGYGEVSLTISGKDITAASFVLHNPDGSVRDQSYGTVNGQIVDKHTYDQAQAGVAAAPQYAATLVQTDDLGKVDAITGATLTHQQFVEAVTDAVKNAHS